MKPNIPVWISFRIVVLVVGIIGVICSATGWAAEVKIKNKSTNPMTLSDLIVYGKKGKKEIILSRNFAIDDVVIPAGETHTFTTSFDVIAIASSITKNGKESELVLKELTANSGFHPVGWVENAVDGSALVPSIDSALAIAPPALGSILSFSGGLNVQLPGWFVGTSLDLDQGTVLGSFTGNATIMQSDVEVASVPEPTVALAFVSVALMMLAIGVPSQIAKRKRFVAVDPR